MRRSHWGREGPVLLVVAVVVASAFQGPEAEEEEEEGTRCMVEHGIARRRRARQSVACHSMVWHCVVKH